MVYVSIPYVPENNRLDKDLVKKEIQLLDITKHAKENTLAAIYHNKPHGVDFSDTNSAEIAKLENVLSKLGIPYRHLEKSDY